MRHTRHLRLTLLTCAVATTVLVGAKSVTNAARGVDPLVADDLAYAEPVYRDGHYLMRDDQRVELRASGGSGELTYRIVNPPTSAGETIGSVAVTDDGATVSIELTADPGPASFSYQALDQEGRKSNVATVSFEVENRSPLTEDLALSTPRGTPLDIWPYARDAEDGGPFPWQREGNRIVYGQPQHGVVEPLFAGDRRAPDAFSVDHKAMYVPDPGYVGPDVFSYRFTDAEGGTSSGSVAVDVTARPALRDGAAEVLYRCPLRVKVGASGQADPAGEYDPDATRIVSRVLGGDLMFRLGVRLSPPRRLEPGEPYTLPPADVDLTMSQSTAGMLAGENVAGDNLDLETAGFGQTAVGAGIAAELHVTEPADEYDVPLTGLQSGPVPLELPAPEAGVTVAMTGTLSDLAAPERGGVVVSMPREFDLDAAFEPGVQEVMTAVGMRCHAVDGQNLELDRVPVRARTRTAADARPVTYGEAPTVTVEVSARANGRVQVFEDTTVLGAALVEDGRARVRLPRDLLAPGAHRLRVAFEGGRGFTDSTGGTMLRVADPEM
ncbi:MAG: Ig-like domain repeat protein [Nocardioidaceae bacterium]